MAKDRAEVTTEICKYLRAGNTITDSCHLAGISKETYYTWKEQHADFSDAVKKAEIECKARNIAIIQKAAEKSWQAAAWYLERKYNTEFALKHLNEVSGPNGAAITVNLNTGTGFTPAPETGALAGPAQIQSISVASAGEEDIDGTQ